MNLPELIPESIYFPCGMIYGFFLSLICSALLMRLNEWSMRRMIRRKLQIEKEERRKLGLQEPENAKQNPPEDET